MLLETYDFGLEVQNLHLILGALLGLVFGAAAQISRFCLRRAVGTGDGAAGAVWLTALGTAILGLQGAGALGLVDVSGHRLLDSDLPVLAIVVGGLMFGVGMVLTRGCVSRLTVLGASGNLRAWVVLAVFAIVAHATIKGVFAPIRTTLGTITLDIGAGALPAWAGLTLGLLVLITGAALARRFGARALHLSLAALIGGVAVLGWAGTSVLLADEFDPMPVQSLAFTLPWTDTLFWTIASTAIPAGFGTGLIGGVLAGACGAALLRGEFVPVSFTSPAEMARYGLGGALMGMGGVLAGGCTLGAGISGVATLSVAALLALVAIAVGGALAGRALRASPALVPAE